MKLNLFVGLTCTAILILTAVAPVAAYEPLPPQLEYIDAQLDIFLPKLADYQSAYLAEYDQYYQALGSHSVIPSGADGADQLEDHPTDQLTSLAPLWDAAGLPTEIQFAFEIHTCVSPQGQGYTLFVTTLVDAVTWTRSIGSGACGMTEPWYQVAEE